MSSRINPDNALVSEIPEGYRFATEEERKCLPRGTKGFNRVSREWFDSHCVGVCAMFTLTYIVPATVEAPVKPKDVLPNVGDVLWDSQWHSVCIVNKVKTERCTIAHRNTSTIYGAHDNVIAYWFGKRDQKKFWQRFSVVGFVDIEKLKKGAA
jgi:hypothetical protein